MTERLRPVALRVGPHDKGPALEIEFADGRHVLVDLDVAHASKIADRLRECVDGRVCRRPPSQRVFELTLVCEDVPDLVDTAPPSAVVPDLDLDLKRQAAE